MFFILLFIDILLQKELSFKLSKAKESNEISSFKTSSISISIVAIDKVEFLLPSRRGNEFLFEIVAETIEFLRNERSAFVAFLEY